MRGKSEHRDLRDEALYEEYKKIRGMYPDMSFDEQIDETLRTKQPRLWVSFYGVYRILLAIVAKKEIKHKKYTRKKLAKDIEDKYIRMQQSPFLRNTSTYFVASFIIAEPSVGFYVSHSYAKRIIFKIIRKKQQERHAKQETHP